MKPKKSAPKGQMGLDGEVAEGGISGDDGQQGMLFGSPATTGEGLTVESTPLFAGTMVPLREPMLRHTSTQPHDRALVARPEFRDDLCCLTAD